jgi:RNA polymerase-binding transcription factor DksA
MKINPNPDKDKFKKVPKKFLKKIKKLTSNGFNFIRAIKKDKHGYCSKCKKIKKMDFPHFIIHKNLIRFAKGFCVKCGTEIFKQLKKDQEE